MKKTVITGTGSYIPTELVTNSDFAKHVFHKEDGSKFDIPNEEIAQKFKSITGIEERRYVASNLCASDIGAIAARRAIEDSNLDPEELDGIIVAHNFGDVKHGTIQTDILPSLASRIKHVLKIKSPKCIAYDVLFGCPGWVQGMIQAEAYIKANMGNKYLVIGTETLSRVLDMHDRDSMIYSDGAGAAVVESKEGTDSGIISTAALSHTYDEAYHLFLGKSNSLDEDERIRYIKMHGRKIYEYALSNVPQAMKACMDKAEIPIDELKKVFIHQANEKMDEAIIKRFYRSFGKKETPEYIMPMSIHKLGNSSVATVPTLFDRVAKGEVENQNINPRDLILFASVGAGMNINAILYRI